MSRYEAELEIAIYGDQTSLPLRTDFSLRAVIAWYLHFERNVRKLAEATVTQFANVLNRLLVEDLMDKPLGHLRPKDLELVFKAKRGTKLSPKSRDEYARVLGRMFTAAMKCGFVDKDISRAFVRQHAVRRQRVLRSRPTEKDFQSVERAASPQALVVFLLLTAMFIGAGVIAWLRWADVDFERGAIFLPASNGAGQSRTGRWRSLPPKLELALMSLRSRSLVNDLSEPLIMSPNGQPLTRDDVAQLVHGAQVRAGLVAANRPNSDEGKVQGMPRGRYTIADFVEVAIGNE
ncbi:MAG: hypothetical protein ACOVS5_12115, partial [Oligoflexus sp.]